MKAGLPVVLTPSRTELGKRCHRRHVISDVLQRGKYYSASLEFGSTCHAGVAEWWKTGDVVKVQEAVRREWNVRFTAEKGLLSPKGLSEPLAQSMMSGYIGSAGLAGTYTPLGPWKVVMVEERLETKVGPYVLSFQVDRLVHNFERDHIVVVDYKTAARLDGKWAEQWERSLQMKLYRYAVMKVFDREEGVDIIVEGQEKTPKGELRYHPCPEWSPAMLEEAVDQFCYVAEQDETMIQFAMREDGTLDLDALIEYSLTQTGVNYHDCNSYNSPCQFLPLCTAEPETRIGLLKSDYLEIEGEY